MRKRKKTARLIIKYTYQVSRYSGVEAIARLIDQVKSHAYPRRIMAAYLAIDMWRGMIEEFEATGRGDGLLRLFVTHLPDVLAQVALCPVVLLCQIKPRVLNFRLELSDLFMVRPV